MVNKMLFVQCDPWSDILVAAFNPVLPTGGYSEMACSQTTPTLWVLLVLT